MESSRQLTLVVPVIRKDLQRFQILLQSLSYFMDPNSISELLVISEDHLFRDYTPQKENTRAGWEMDLFPPPPIKARNLTFSQITKGNRTISSALNVSNFIYTSFYLFLPSDSFSTKKWGINDLIRSDKAMIQLDSIEISDIIKISQLLEMNPLMVGDKVISRGPAIL